MASRIYGAQVHANGRWFSARSIDSWAGWRLAYAGRAGLVRLGREEPGRGYVHVWEGPGDTIPEQEPA